MNLSFNFLKDTKNSWLFALLLSLFAGVAMAGTGGTEFNGMFNMIVGWIEGGLGRTISLAGIVIGACVFIFGGKVNELAKTIGGAIFVASVAVGLVNVMFTAVI